MNAQDILKLIGNTPLVEARNLVKNKNVKLFLKLEGNNPGGSLKDRPAYNMIVSALDRGDIKKGDKLIEATSGNTGIALAMISQLLGIEIIDPSSYMNASFVSLFPVLTTNLPSR